MALIEEELGQPWQEIYSELTTSPIAAGNFILKIVWYLFYFKLYDIFFYLAILS